MQDNPNNKFNQFKTLESTQDFFKWIPDNCKENILQALYNIWKIENSYDRWVYEIESSTPYFKINMKINRANDVMEYDEYNNERFRKFIWKQLFKREAIQRLWIEKKLPTEEDIRTIIDSQAWETLEEKYQTFYTKYIKNNLLWHYNTPHESIHCADSVLFIWLQNWKILAFSEEKFGVDDPVQDSFFHVMLFDEIQRDIELAKKYPKLEAENYKIDTDFSTEEKLQHWWTEEIDENWIDYLQKHLWWKAYVQEYLGWVDKEYIWEQKFNGFAADLLWLRDKMPKDYEEFKKIVDKWIKENNSNYEWFMKRYFSKNGKLMLSGYWNSDDKEFDSIGNREYCWLWDGRNVVLGEDSMGRDGGSSRFGFSVRLVEGR